MHLISSAVLTFFLLYVIILQIEDGEIFATINQRDGMVRFHDNPEKYNSARMLVKLDDEVGHVIIRKTNKCLVLRKPVFLGFPTRFDTKRAVQSQKMPRGLKFRI